MSDNSVVGEAYLPYADGARMIRRLGALLALALLLAGCASSDKPASQDAPTDAATTTATTTPTKAAASSGGSASGDNPLAIALEKLQKGTASRRWSVDVNTTSTSLKWNRHTLFYDYDRHVVIDEYQTEGFAAHGKIRVNNTTISLDQLGRAVFDPSAGLYSGPTGAAVSEDPQSLPTEGELQFIAITKPREQADENLNGEVFTTRYVFDRGLVWMEKNATRLVKTGTNGVTGTHRLTLEYEENATHRLLEGALRAEALTLLDVAATKTLDSGGTVRDYNWTVKDTNATLRVPLDDVEIRILTSTGRASLVLPLTMGTNASKEARLTFVDVDADGYVSPGDTLRGQILTSNGSLAALDLVLADLHGLTLGIT